MDFLVSLLKLFFLDQRIQQKNTNLAKCTWGSTYCEAVKLTLDPFIKEIRLCGGLHKCVNGLNPSKSRLGEAYASNLNPIKYKW